MGGGGSRRGVLWSPPRLAGGTRDRPRTHRVEVPFRTSHIMHLKASALFRKDGFGCRFGLQDTTRTRRGAGSPAGRARRPGPAAAPAPPPAPIPRPPPRGLPKRRAPAQRGKGPLWAAAPASAAIAAPLWGGRRRPPHAAALAEQRRRPPARPGGHPKPVRAPGLGRCYLSPPRPLCLSIRRIISRAEAGGRGGREGAGKAAPPRSRAAAGSHAASSCRGNSCLGARDPRPPTSGRAGDFKRGQRGPAPAASSQASGAGVAPLLRAAARDCRALQSPPEKETVCPTDWQGMLRHPVRSLVQGLSRAGRKCQPGVSR
ncbi:hypothetical protein P7K49_019392 [Saguinus oedipus]|uniref:Uncharacterized protein n=1 Tax=Saguinus oedipus TaxID=9490 RepID=A0ABQ9UX71_SAGOE|nr:hypothetical protein P7K49_019392 [Saguinus oedipus]